MPDTENNILIQKEEEYITLDGISMFLNPIEYTNLSMTAKKVTFGTKEEIWEFEQESVFYCSIQ